MTALAHDTLDQTRAAEFAGRAVQLLNDGFLSLMVSIGHQTGLFDTMAQLEPSTSEQIAAAAGLNERYVREWLGGMVTGGIVTYDRTSGHYVLPAEHAQSLTRAAGADNVAFFMQYVTLIGALEQELIGCVRNGGGLPYSAFPRFQELQGEETRRVYDATLLQKTLPSIDGLVERLTAGIDVADIGCGQGHALNVMAKAFPNSRFSGYDISAEGLHAARAEAREMRLENARFELVDLAELEARASYDVITAFDVIHDQVRPREVLRRVERALRSDGMFLMVDIAAATDVADNVEHPFGPTLYGLSMGHCMTVSLAHGGEGLGTVWGEERASELLAEAGFADVSKFSIEGDVLNVYFVARR